MLSGKDEVDWGFQLPLADAGEDLLDNHLFVEGVVTQQVDFEVIAVANWGDRYWRSCVWAEPLRRKRCGGWESAGIRILANF